ncbi:MAG TPA: hypothetical protein PLP29_11015 [Candidatus Ozemobacteraceae bacterium]|nr:hypothetical protein [Candidatus Ozemobacteraceae bacterium]
MNGHVISGCAARRRGSAILIALGLGFVLLVVIASLQSFSSYRIQNSIMENRNLKALALAEAGISFAMTELGLDSSFRTHTIKIDAAKKELAWDQQVDWQTSVANDADFSFSQQNTSGKGSYQGTLGDGQFRFRVGLIPYEDDPRSKNIDESKCYFKIDAMGRVGDTTRSVSCIVQRRFPGREFLMFDMEFLSIVYGEPGETNINKFSTGNLYGHKGVEIGQILLDAHSPTTPGTKQELFDMHSIISGAGGIFFWQPTKVEFRARPGMPAETVTIPPSNIPFPSHGTYSSPEAERYGEVPAEIAGKVPTFPDSVKEKLKGRILDKNAMVSLSPGTPKFADLMMQAQNGGKYIPAAECTTQYKITPGWNPNDGDHVKAAILDFGNGIHKGNVTLPSNFNGVIFSDSNLVIKGNPPRDVKIVSKKSIFVAGDFNQRNNKTRKEERYSFPQNYDVNAMDSEDYSTTAKNLLLDDLSAGANPDDPAKFKHHFAANVIANERIVYDYRSPIDCFENEIYPYMKFALAKELIPESDAETNMLNISGSGEIDADLTDKAATKNKIASYFEKFPLCDENREKELATEFSDTFNTNKITDADYEKFCNEKLWDAYRKSYETNYLEREAGKPKLGVYKLLTQLRAKICDASGKPKQDKADDYLHFPEMTTNGIFQSCGVRSNLFYMGPDYSKRYDEMGRSLACVSAGVGLQHSDMKEMIHRVYGSEVRYATNKTLPRITGPSYAPPTRRKLYDPTLPSLDIGDGSGDIAAFVILTWKDLRGSPAEYTNF